MDKFEAACEELKLELIVLPPSSPKYNGGTERGNRTFREEFYESHKFRANSLGEAKFELTKALQNTILICLITTLTGSLLSSILIITSQRSQFVPVNMN